MLWHKLPPSIYFRRGCMATAVDDLKGKHKAFIVSDAYLLEHTPHVHLLVELLRQQGIDSKVFHEVQADPNLSTVSLLLPALYVTATGSLTTYLLPMSEDLQRCRSHERISSRPDHSNWWR